MANKSGKITPIRLSNEARMEIERRKSESGDSLVKIVEKSIMENGRFNSRIEAEINLYQHENDCSRQDAIEAMLIDAIAFRASLKSDKPRHKNQVNDPKAPPVLERFEGFVRKEIRALKP